MGFMKKPLRMKKSYVKFCQEYEEANTLDAKNIVEAMKRYKESPKEANECCIG
jgi:hypothetical protein